MILNWKLIEMKIVRLPSDPIGCRKVASGRLSAWQAVSPQHINRVWRVIEVVITSCTRNAVVRFRARGFESHTLRSSSRLCAYAKPAAFLLSVACRSGQLLLFLSLCTLPPFRSYIIISICSVLTGPADPVLNTYCPRMI